MCVCVCVCVCVYVDVFSLLICCVCVCVCTVSLPYHCMHLLSTRHIHVYRFNIFASYLPPNSRPHSIYCAISDQTDTLISCVLSLVGGTEMVILFKSHDQPFIILLLDDPVILCLISNYSGVCAWECLSYLISISVPFTPMLWKQLVDKKVERGPQAS